MCDTFAGLQNSQLTEGGGWHAARVAWGVAFDNRLKAKSNKHKFLCVW